MAVNVNAKLLAAVAVAQFDGSNKRNIDGVYVSRHMLQGLLIVATNGHIITVAHDIDGTTDREDNVIFELSRSKIVALSAVGGIVDLDERFKTVDGVYPDWRRAIPDFKEVTPGAVVGYCSNVFNKIIKTCDMLGDNVCFTTFGGENGCRTGSPVLVRYSEFPNLFSVVMPCAPDTSKIPSFEIPFMIL